MKYRALIVRVCWLGFLLSGIVLLTNMAQINQVKCVIDQTKPCPDHLNQSLSGLIGQKLLARTVSQTSISALVAPEYQLISYKLVWPSQILVVVRPLRLIYQIKSGQSLLAVTDEGTVVPATDQNLVVVESSFIDDQTSQIARQMHAGLTQVINSLDQAGIAVQKIVWSGNHDSTLTLSSGQTVIFDEADIDTNLDRLKIILRSRTITDQLPLFQTIDVRFRLPVLRK